MLIPKEVRLGNIVEFEGKQYEIDCVHAEFPSLNTAEFGHGVITWEKLKGVPITEEYLQSAGFEKIEFDYFAQFYKNEQLIISQFDRVFYKVGEDYSHELQYIHQLQNLYFELTGNELI